MVEGIISLFFFSSAFVCFLYAGNQAFQIVPAIFPCRSRSAGFRVVPYVALQCALLGIMKSVAPPVALESRVSFIVHVRDSRPGPLSSDLTHLSSQKSSYPGSSCSQKVIIHSALVAALFATSLISSSQVDSFIAPSVLSSRGCGCRCRCGPAPRA